MSDTPSFAPTAAWVTCPKCAAQVPCYDPAGSEYFGCFNCRTYFKADPTATGRPAAIVTGFRQELPPGPSLPLGATGTLGSYQCRITGYQVRGEQQDRTAEWREYQLRPLTPIVGDDPIDFPLQLAEYQGHWLLIRRARQFPATRGSHSFQAKEWTSTTTGNTYRLWHRYQPVVRDAQGEFDWNILDDDHLKIQEFICPPYLLSSEQPPHAQTIWYLSEYLEPRQVAAAFGLDVGRLPNRQGTGAAEPNPHQTGTARRLFWVSVFLLLSLAGWLALTRPSATTTETFTVPAVPAAPESALAATLAASASAAPTTPLPAAPATSLPGTGYNQMLVSKTIVLTYPSAVDITFTAPDLTNHWLEVTASLVNEQTGRGYEVTRSLEYYEGVEDGEHWTEGDHSASAVISGLPAGRYHLNLYPSAEAGVGYTTLQLQVEQHSGFASNFWLILLLMSALPLWQWARHGSFETSRWENSDFGPTT